MSPVGGLGKSTFAGLRYRNYRLYFFGQAASIAGTWMQNVAAAWLLLRLTNSAFDVGLLVLCQTGPFVVFGLHGGLVADRFDSRRIVLFTQSIQVPIAATLAAVTLLGDLHPWLLFVASALTGTVTVFDTPARQSLAHRLVGREGVQNAVALNMSLFNSGRVIGPALGGVIIAAAGAGWCFAINAVSFLAVITGLLMMRPSEFFNIARPEKPPTVWRGTVEALRYVRAQPALLLTLCATFVLASLSLNSNVLIPVLARQTLHTGAQGFGFVSASNGIGALVGALFTAAFARTSRPAWVAAGVVIGLMSLAIAPVRDVVLASVLLFIIGGTSSVLGATANASIQLAAPAPLRGRMISLYLMAAFIGQSAGSLVVGWLCGVGGTELAFYVAGASALATMTAVGIVLRGDRVVAARWKSAFGPRLMRESQATVAELDEPL